MKANRWCPGVDLIKLFCVNVFTLFLSYIFSKHRKIMSTWKQWSSLQKSVSKFTPKKFHEVNPWVEFATLDVGALFYVTQLDTLRNGQPTENQLTKKVNPIMKDHNPLVEIFGMSTHDAIKQNCNLKFKTRLGITLPNKFPPPPPTLSVCVHSLVMVI